MGQAQFRRRDRRHRLGDRAAVLPSSGSAARGHGPGHRRGTSGVRPGAVATDDTRRAGGVSPGHGRQARGAGVGLQRDVAARIRGGARLREGQRIRQPRDAAVLRGPGRRLPIRGGLLPERDVAGGWRVRPPRPRARRGGGRDHPVERAAAAHPDQGRPGAAGRMHGDREGLARGSRCWIPDRGDRRGGGPAGRRAERHHRRPRGVRAHGA